VNAEHPQSSPKQPPKSVADNQGSNWDLLFLKRSEQLAFSTLWLAVVAGCVWYFVSQRGYDPIDIDHAATQTVGFRVEINFASKHEFACLPGIGVKTAARITQWRDQHGPFESVDSLAEVPGVSVKMLEKLRPWLHHQPQDKISKR